MHVYLHGGMSARIQNLPTDDFRYVAHLGCGRVLGSLCLGACGNTVEKVSAGKVHQRSGLGKGRIRIPSAAGGQGLLKTPPPPTLPAPGRPPAPACDCNCRLPAPPARATLPEPGADLGSGGSGGSSALRRSPRQQRTQTEPSWRPDAAPTPGLTTCSAPVLPPHRAARLAIPPPSARNLRRATLESS